MSHSTVFHSFSPCLKLQNPMQLPNKDFPKCIHCYRQSILRKFLLPPKDDQTKNFYTGKMAHLVHISSTLTGFYIFIVFCFLLMLLFFGKRKFTYCRFLSFWSRSCSFHPIISFCSDMYKGIEQAKGKAYAAAD